MRLAIADAELATGDLLSYAARRRGHQVACVSDVERLFERLPFEPSAVVVALDALDPDAPKLAGRVRQRFAEQVFVVTMERPRETVTRAILSAGADDVVRTPYNPVELVLKVESALSRRASAPATEGLRVGDLEIVLDNYWAVKNGTKLDLTKLELRLLYCLCSHYPNLTPIERLLVFGWDGAGDPDAVLVKTHISHIRTKLARAGGARFEIVSRQTLGYVLTVAPVGGEPAGGDALASAPPGG
jgi:DNA-binding response OmpR family regulator